MNGNWKGAYGYDTKQSMYSTDYHSSKKTVVDIGVGTRQQTMKRCGIVKTDREKLMSNNSEKQCESGTCPWR